MVDEPTI